MVVLAVLAMVGYGLYVGLNNGFQFQNVPAETPDWIQQEMTAPGGVTQPLGQEVSVSAPVSLGQPVAAGQAAADPSPTAPPSDRTSPSVPQAQYSVDVQSRLGGTPQGPISTSSGPVAIQPGSQTTGPDGGVVPPQSPIASVPQGSSNPTAGNTKPTNPLYPSLPPVADTAAGTQAPPQAVGAVPEVPGANELNLSNDLAFNTAMNSAKSQLQKGQLATALLTLSIWYEDPRLNPIQQNELTQLLDKVAGSVIYSRKHLIEPAYSVQRGETLSKIAEKYRVSVGLLAKINGIQNPGSLAVGEQIKVIRGPFNATINGEKSELTLWLSGRYAGRFSVAMGPEFQGIVGPFVVQEKTRIHTGHQNQPWIQLTPGYGNSGNLAPSEPSVGIAGMQQPEQVKQGSTPGQIGVSVRDADDLFDILSQGSKVTIQR